jgi:cytoskeletal protein RodZ
MAAISETLRQARLRSGIDLDRLADKTKINPRYLKAIEAGDFGQLPSGIFARMFIKQYADAVGLDGASFAEEFQRMTSFGQDFAPDVQTIVATRQSYHPNVRGLSSVGDRVRSERIASMLSSFIWVVGAILVCAGAYYGLAHLPSRSTVATAKAPPATHAASAQPGPAKALSPSPAPAASPTPPPAVPSEPAPSAAIQLGISATEPVWVTALADGKTVFSELLPAGASKMVAGTDSARLTLGNAGGAEVTFNGKKLEPFGPKGQVRTVEFTPRDFQVISRTSPNPEPSRNPDPLR